MDAALAEAGKSTIKVLQGTSWDMDTYGWLPMSRCKCDKNDPVIFALSGAHHFKVYPFCTDKSRNTKTYNHFS